MSEVKSIIIDDITLKNYLSKVVQKNMDIFPLLQRIGGLLRTATDENFNAEGRPKWKPLSNITLKIRKRLGYTGPILQRRGTLVRSINTIIQKDFVAVGTNEKYAAIQQFGGIIKHPGGTKYGFIDKKTINFRKNSTKKYLGKTKPHNIAIPARPYLGIQPTDLEDIIETTKEYLTGDK